MKYIVIIFVCTLLSACATTQVNSQTAKPVPADRVYIASFIKSSNPENNPTVSFFRDSGLLGSGCTYDIFVNNAKAFSINPAEFIELTLEPKEYIFRLSYDYGLCPNLTMTQDAILKNGTHRTYRISISGQVEFSRID